MNLTPKAIVQQLDRYIIGQTDAKRSVAVALRNRYRRSLLDEKLREEITPKNIIMIGPTGVGKTEIARRLAKLAHAPFVKVEATKFTEVGYVGRDVESIIRELVEASIRMVKNEKMEGVKHKAAAAAEERLLDALLPSRKRKASAPFTFFQDSPDDAVDAEIISSDSKEEAQQSTREKFRQMLRAGKLEDSLIEIEVDESRYPGAGLIAGMGNEEMMIQIQDVFGNLFPKKTRIKKTSVREARRLFEQEEAQKIIDMDEVIDEAVRLAEQNGIVFIDEIDKIAGKEMGQGPDVSREGVQRDILPIVEGTVVMTKYGPIRTDYMLFIAAGAFHVSKISDLIPELQGRFPIRVELKSLTEQDFKQILTQPENAIIKQHIALMKTEGLDLVFTDDAIDEIAKIAYLMNQSRENIGARRLHTVMEKLLEELSYHAEDLKGQTITVNSAFVRQNLNDILQETDMHKYIL
ncbi:MAG: ATP-dependent protease ATPase subunit HslU [Caldicoprobacterales bacterium]|jgi:ATP-dependent HslUV protease ATP-binding subunit HslU|nr:ATP-dependent protease ATPase subunit HslU [Clostridiales bacterium]